MKNLWNKLKCNKRLLWGCVAGVVCLCLVLGMVLLGGGNGGQGGESSGDIQLGGITTESTQPGASESTQKPGVDTQPGESESILPGESTGAETNPGESTNNTEGDTQPEENTDPAEPTENTEPVVTVPPVTEPTPTEPVVDNNDTLPNEDDQIPTGDTNPPADSTGYDFGDWNPGNITWEIVKEWDKDKIAAFLAFYDFSDDWSLEWSENWNREYVSEGYFCGMEGHHCLDAQEHEYIMGLIEAGCEICGKHDCPALYGRSSWGGMAYDKTLCPEYDEHDDPSMWCPYCGLPTLLGGEIGDECCQRGWRADYECSHCGETVYLNECHHCIRKH